MSFSPGRSGTVFPSDLFYSHIIPDILSEHLHQLLVEDFSPRWHPFYTLPLVSRAFYDTCRMMCSNIFGPESNGSTILRVLDVARDFWDHAKQPPLRSQPIDNSFSYAQLMSSKSLIQVYICTALAHCFFKLDVLWSLELEARAPELQDAEPDPMDLDWAERPRRFRMRDETMHRVYLPLTCAMKLCDHIRPERLAYIIAQHLADIVPRYSTEPVLLKYTQDLETYNARQHRVDAETWAEWTSRTLHLIEGTPDLLKKMQNMGKLVKSYKQTSSIPRVVLKEINIIEALRTVMDLDWGTDTYAINGHAADLLQEWDFFE